ncbi:MAG: hypothetical protein PUG21_01970 [Prevotella sp.]|nr:hypothetical protein [Prevotella sp.]MDY2702618.1 hypothetical protein [Prevotella sp.]
MRRIGANDVITPDGEILSPAVVEIDNGMVQQWYRLDMEMPFTEWIGGTIELQADNNGNIMAIKNNRILC